MEKLTGVIERNNQCLAGMQHQAQQLRLVAEADIKQDTKTRKRMEGAAADAENNGNISSVQVDDDPMHLTRFGNQEFTEPPQASVKNIDDALVDKRAEAPKPHLPPVVVRILAPCGLRHAGSVCATLKIMFLPHPLPWNFSEMIEKMIFSTMKANHAFAKYNNFWHSKVIKRKSTQNLVFDPGGCSDDIRSLSVFVERKTASSSSSKKGKQFGTPYVIAANRYFPGVREKQLSRVTRQTLTIRGCKNCEGRTDGK